MGPPERQSPPEGGTSPDRLATEIEDQSTGLAIALAANYVALLDAELVEEMDR